jgi:hypothetical protein
MADKPKKLSDTARAVLTLAATRNDRLIRPPRLPVAAVRQVVRSLLNAGLANEVPTLIDDAGFARRAGGDGGLLMLRATELGLARLGEGEAGSPTPKPVAAEAWETTGADAGAAVAGPAPLVTGLAAYGSPQAQDGRDDAHRGEDADTVARGHGDTAQAAVEPPGAVPAPTAAPMLASRHGGLRQAAQAFLDAWEARAGDDDDSDDTLNGPVTALRAALAVRASMPTSAEASHARRDTKQARVLAMLRRNEGASGPQIAEAMGWASHTVRGFLAGLAKKGIQVDVLERVRQVGPNKQGAKGSYSVYRVAGEAAE